MGGTVRDTDELGRDAPLADSGGILTCHRAALRVRCLCELRRFVFQYNDHPRFALGPACKGHCVVPTDKVE